jgi:hypothetical protein
MYPRPTGRGVSAPAPTAAPTAAPRGGLLSPQELWSIYLTRREGFAPAPTSTSRWPPSAASVQVLSYHGQGGSCSCSHLSALSWPAPAAEQQTKRFHGKVGSCSLTHIQIATVCRANKGPVEPRARRGLLPRPEHLDVAACCCPITGMMVPRAWRVLRPPTSIPPGCRFLPQIYRSPRLTGKGGLDPASTAALPYDLLLPP